MKKLLLLVAVLACCGQAFAQLELNVRGAYAVGLSEDNSVQNAEWQTKKRGEGPEVGIGGLVKLTDHLGVGADLFFNFQASKLTLRDMQQNGVSNVVKISSNHFGANPYLMLTTKRDRIAYGYLKIGLSIVSGYYHVNNDTMARGYGSGTKRDFSGGVGFGPLAGLGVGFKLTDHLGLRIGAEGLVNNYRPTTLKTEYSSPGIHTTNTSDALKPSNFGSFDLRRISGQLTVCYSL